MRERFKPKLAVPVDFQSFWDKTLSELAQVPSALEQIPQAVPEEENILYEELSFESLEGVKISGYRLVWQDEKKRPLVIHAHGYQSQCQVQWDWARQGLHVLGVDIRGFGKSEGAVPRLSHWGYVLTGRESPERYILRGAVCDYVRAVQVGRELFHGKTERLLLHGVSFAGGLALIAEALSPAADLLVLGVPTFGWVEGRLFFVKSGSGLEISRYLEDRPEATEDLIGVLRYFDPVSFAGKIKCPTLMGVGLEDEVVPAKTVFAIVNHLSCPLEIMKFPFSHSARPEERLWQKFDHRWIELAKGGQLKG